MLPVGGRGTGGRRLKATDRGGRKAFPGPREIWRPPRDIVLLILSGLLLALAHPPFHLLFPSFTALVPYALWLEGLPRGTNGRREAVRGGFFLGLLYYGLLLHWLAVALVFHTWLAPLAFLATVLGLAVILALATLGIHHVHRRGGWPVWLALPVFWTAQEWFRGQLGGLAFPWQRLGETLTGYPWLMGAADLVGGSGLSFWLALVNGLLAALVAACWRRARGPAAAPAGGVGADREGRGGRSGGASGGGFEAASRGGVRALAAGLAVAVAVPTAYSLYRHLDLETREVATVGVLQPNIPQELKLDPPAAVDSTLRSSRALLDGEAGGWAGAVDLVVFPEATFPVAVEPVPARGWEGAPGLETWVGEVARGLGAPVLYGATGIDELPGGGIRHYNSSFLVDSRGRRTARYDKRRLVPVVERVPFLQARPARSLARWVDEGLRGSAATGPPLGGYSAGRGEPPLFAGSGGFRFGVLVCYEAIFPDLARDYRDRGGDFLVNVTNDGWFGRREPAWSRTSALWQHPAHLVVRAVENRMGVARSANTGVSQVVDPLGRVSHSTPLFEPAAFRATVSTTGETTLYTRLGDVVPGLAALAALVGIAAPALLPRFRRRRSGTPRRPPSGG